MNNFVPVMSTNRSQIKKKEKSEGTDKVITTNLHIIETEARLVANITAALTGNSTELTSYLLNIYNRTQKMQQNIFNIVDMTPEIDRCIAKDMFPVEISYIDGMVHASFNELLPHRIKINANTGKTEYTYNKTRYMNSFRSASAELCERNPDIFYCDKCMVYIINYYNENWYDHDNIEIKQLIDHLVKPFVPEDNSKCISLFMDAEEGECRTEIFFGKEVDVLQLIQKRKMKQ